MDVSRHTEQACCGRVVTIFKLSQPIDHDLIAQLVGVGFKELTHFTAAGMLYVENSDFILTGRIGSNKLQSKCRKELCDNLTDSLEKVLRNIN